MVVPLSQACSAKSLERLRSQQESLRSLKPQVVYLRDLAMGLVQDAPQTPGGGADGARRLQEHARDTEKEYEAVTDKVRAGPLTLRLMSSAAGTRSLKVSGFDVLGLTFMFLVCSTSSYTS